MWSLELCKVIIEKDILLSWCPSKPGEESLIPSPLPQTV